MRNCATAGRSWVRPRAETPSPAHEEIKRISKPNLFVLILLLLLVPLTVGCGGSGRKGIFLQLGGGIAPIYANQEWTSKVIRSREVINQSHHEATVISVLPVGNFKIGYGITEQLLVSFLSQRGKLSLSGGGITVFHKTDTPSLFVDIVIAESKYSPDEFPLSDSFSGSGGSVGIGYEFTKNWTVQANLSYGEHDFSGSEYVSTPTDPTEVSSSIGGFYEFFGNILANLARDGTTYDAKSTGYSLGFTISYIWY